MQLLIVHHDAEVGEQLLDMLDNYTSHTCDWVESELAAVLWAQEHPHCGLLLTQVDGPSVDGFRLGGSLSEAFPGLQTLFLPSYPATARRIDIAQTKVFPEPIDGDRLLEAIETAGKTGPQASDFFEVLDVLQMCCLSGCTGAVQVVKGDRSGIVYLQGGRIIHAELPHAGGVGALHEIAAWGLVEFAYDESLRGPATITTKWDEVLTAAVIRNEPESSREGDDSYPNRVPGTELIGSGSVISD